MGSEATGWPPGIMPEMEKRVSGCHKRARWEGKERR